MKDKIIKEIERIAFKKEGSFFYKFYDKIVLIDDKHIGLIPKFITTNMLQVFEILDNDKIIGKKQYTGSYINILNNLKEEK